MKRMTRLPGLVAVFAGLLLATGMAWAADETPVGMTPVGTWKIVDQDTGNTRAVVQLSEVDGELRGMISRVLLSDDGPHPLCKKCTGKLQDQPVEGMVFLWGLHKDGDAWTGGKILDTDNGKIYKAKLELFDDGSKLKLRRYSGMSMLGHSQEWRRQP